MDNTFKELNLRSELTTNLEEIGFVEMTPIQKGALPFVLKGRDVIGQAKTGSGKTAAFGLGVLNSLNSNDVNTKVLILCPTRELALQVSNELRKLAQMIQNVKILTITGGVSYVHQEKSLLHGAHIIVGTPGRVAKLIKTEYIKLADLSTFILDEADRMLDMGFYDEILAIEKKLPKKRQTLLFSATFPEEILKLSSNVQFDAESIIVDAKQVDIEEHFYELKSHKDKNESVLRVLGEYSPNRLIIFCKTKVITDKVASFLRSQGVLAQSIHGDIDQNERTKVLTKFSNNSLSILVATDVAARGLDIKDLACVINYDLPVDTEDYIHRIGRTGRAGKKGLAFSFFVEAETYKVEKIEEKVEKKFNLKSIESLGEKKQYLEVPPMETIFISRGKKDKIRPGDILGVLIKQVGLESDDVGDISVLNVLSYVAINRNKVKDVIAKLSDAKIKKRSFRTGLVL